MSAKSNILENQIPSQNTRKPNPDQINLFQFTKNPKSEPILS